jgi:hypothetical protein
MPGLPVSLRQTAPPGAWTRVPVLATTSRSLSDFPLLSR